MGGVQQRPSEVWLTIERNKKSAQSELFNFSKERYIVHNNIIAFPSYIKYNQQSKITTYSLFNEQQDEILRLDRSQGFNPQLIFTKITGNLKDKIWKLLRQDEEIQLKKGDFIKMGKIQLKIKELKFLTSKQSLKNLYPPQQNQQDKKTLESSPNFSSSNYLKNSDILSKFARMKDSDISIGGSIMMGRSISTQRSHNQLCRFCFEGTSTQSNPLFNVCFCSGSVKNIHYQCLRNWVRNKTGRVQTSHCIYYHYEPLICELCKRLVNNQINHNGKVYPLYQPQKMHPPYVRFQHTQNNKQFQILIRLEEQARINIGRGPQNQLNLNDQTISKSQCSLFYTSQKLFLKAKSSKYGTFVQLSKINQFSQNKPMELLIHNNFLTIDPKISNGILDGPCCNFKNPYRLIVK